MHCTYQFNIILPLLLDWGSFLLLFVSGYGPITESTGFNYVLKCSFSTKDLKHQF